MKHRKIWIGSVLVNMLIFPISALSFCLIENKIISLVTTIISFFVILCLEVVLTEIYCKYKEKMRIKKKMKGEYWK